MRQAKEKIFVSINWLNRSHYPDQIPFPLGEGTDRRDFRIPAKLLSLTHIGLAPPGNAETYRRKKNKAMPCFFTGFDHPIADKIQPRYKQVR